jgi:hypothetical protein
LAGLISLLRLIRLALLSHDIAPLYQQALYRAVQRVLILLLIEHLIAALPIDSMGDGRIIAPQRRKQKAYGAT